MLNAIKHALASSSFQPFYYLAGNFEIIFHHFEHYPQISRMS